MCLKSKRIGGQLDRSIYFNDQLKEEVSKRLKEIIPGRLDHLDPEVSQTIMEFSDGGKKVRPLSLMLTAAALGVDPTDDLVLDAAVALELSHRSTLIIDDSIDGSQTRNELPTLAVSLGPEVASLSASAMQSIAIEVSPPKFASLLSHGVTQTQKGQMMEVSFRWQSIGQIEYKHDKVVEFKSASLEDAAFRIATEVGLGYEIDRLESVANYLAFAYQAGNDLSDLEPWLFEESRHPPDDLKNRTLTFPMRYAVEASLNDGNEYLLSYLRSGEPHDMSRLRRELKEFIPTDLIRSQMNQWIQKSVLLLETLLPRNEYSRALQDLISTNWAYSYGAKLKNSSATAKYPDDSK